MLNEPLIDGSVSYCPTYCLALDSWQADDGLNAARDFAEGVDCAGEKLEFHSRTPFMSWSCTDLPLRLVNDAWGQ